jgi:hypothetical protein
MRCGLFSCNFAGGEKMAENSEKRARGKGRPFEKGKSGNPAGRPKIDEDTKAILKAAAPDAAKLLVKMMEDPKQNPKLRLQAAETVLDRVFGKATQPIEGNMENRVEVILGGAERYAD